MASLFEGLKSIIGQRRPSAIVSPAGVQMGGRIAFPARGKYLFHVEHGYKRNPVVAACIGLLTSTMNEPPLGVAEQDGTVNLNHPAAVMFRRPNQYMGQAQFWGIVWQFIETSGNAYVRKLRAPAGNITGYVPYSDANVAPVVGRDGWVTGYRYVSGDVDETWPASEVIHLRNPLYTDPLNLHMGMSPIEVAWEKIVTYNELQATIYSLVASNAVPSGILTAPGQIGGEQVEMLKSQLEKRRDAKGKERTRPLVLGDGMTYVQMGLDAQRLQAGETTRELEASICSAFRIAPQVLGLSAGLQFSGYNNMQSAYAEFTTLLRVPLWNAIEEQMEAGIAKDFPGIQLAFDLSQVQALNPKTEPAVVVSQFAANILTANEARVALGYEPAENGDRLSYEMTPSVGFMSAPQDAEQKDAAAAADPVEAVEGDRVRWSEPWATKSWQQEVRVLASFEVETAKQARTFIESARKGALSKVKAVKAEPADGVNVEELVRQFMTANKSTREALALKIIELTVTGTDINLAEVQSFIDVVIADQTKITADNMRKSAQTLKDEVAQISREYAGDVAGMREAITQKFATITDARAGMIARTTVRAQSTVVQKSTIRNLNARQTDEGKKRVMVWLSMRDDQVRESHDELDGQYVEAGELWTKHNAGITEGPGVGTDPAEVINCRCVMRPVTKARLKGIQ